MTNIINGMSVITMATELNFSCSNNYRLFFVQTSEKVMQRIYRKRKEWEKQDVCKETTWVVGEYLNIGHMFLSLFSLL